MKIAVIGSNTTLGRKVVIKAEDKKIHVVGMARSAENLVGQGIVVLKDYDKLSLEDFADCHYVIDTVSFPHIDHYAEPQLPLWHLLEVLKGQKSKLLLVGSSAFLYTDKERKTLLINDSRLCYEQQDQRLEQCVAAFNRLKQNQSCNWTVLSPPLVLDRRGYGTGKFELGDDLLPMDLKGNSSITLNDFASAIIELLLRGFKPQTLLSVRQVL